MTFAQKYKRSDTKAFTKLTRLLEIVSLAGSAISYVTNLQGRIEVGQLQLSVSILVVCEPNVTESVLALRVPRSVNTVRLSLVVDREVCDLNLRSSSFGGADFTMPSRLFQVSPASNLSAA